MKLKIFSVRDTRLGIYMQPIFMQHVGQVVRSWEEMVNDPKTTLCKHPSDYSLYELGEFDEDAGTFAALPVHKLIATAKEFRKERPEQMF